MRKSKKLKLKLNWPLVFVIILTVLLILYHAANTGYFQLGIPGIAGAQITTPFQIEFQCQENGQCGGDVCCSGECQAPYQGPCPPGQQMNQCTGACAE